MPKPRINDLVSCRHFAWRLGRRNGVYFADGRSNAINAGRHSLGTRDRQEALKLVHQLDEHVAKKLLRPDPAAANSEVPTNGPSSAELTLEEGRKLYEEHLKRPRAAGGTRKSTQKRYRTVFDKFIEFAKAKNVTTWNEVTTQLVTNYLASLDDDGYAGKTLKNEAGPLMWAQSWLIAEKHLVGVERIRIKLRNVESERAYCYTAEQVNAMVEYCKQNHELGWLEVVIVGLACTGLRIAEFASLRWTDIDSANNQLTLTDESGRSGKSKRKRRELKSGRSRSLPIHPDFAEVLAKLPRHDDFIFHGPRGGQLKPDTVRRLLVSKVLTPLAGRFRSPGDVKGFIDGRLHSFRHYFASMCANRNVPERVAMQWLGHRDSQMVKHYYHLHDQESQQQMARLDLLGTTGKQLAGIQRAANNCEEQPSTESAATTA